MYESEMVREDVALSSESTPLRWPPPGLEAMQGLAGRATALLGLGTGLMVVPMLIALGWSQAFWSVGMFGGSWWLPIALSVLGVLILLAGLERLTRLLFDGVRAVQRGHDWMTVAYVMSDSRHDAGFLLQGARQYATLPERDRRMLLAARVVAVAGYTIALLWTLLAFVGGIVLAGQGVIETAGGLTAFVIAPAAVLLLAAVLAHALETRTTRSIVRAWRRDTTCESRLLDEVSDWRADRATRLIHLTPATHRTVAGRAAAFSLIVIAALIPLPVLTLALAGAMGPAVSEIAMPRMASTAARVAKASMLEPYAVPTDAGMTAAEAGEVLYALGFTGSAERGRLDNAPVRFYDPWPRESKPVTMPNIEAFGTQLIPRAASLTAEEMAYLERVVQYPALRDLSRVARAREADLTAARWNVAGLAGVGGFDLPLPRFSGLRDATQFHTAKAVLELANGNVAAADTTLREVISIGLLVMREGPTLIDVMVGSAIARNGAAALETLYRTTGRHADADALLRPQEGIDRMEQITRALQTEADVDALLRRSMVMAGNDALPRGMRWEGLVLVQMGAGCMNLHNAVFGHGEEYRDWLARTRASLVRYPSEEALFDAVTAGPLLPAQLNNRATVLQRLFGLTLGDESAEACAAMLAGLSAT